VGAIYTYENDAVHAYAISSGYLAKPSLAENNWKFPKEGGTVAIAFQRGSLHELTDVVDLDTYIFDRWRSYRV